MAGFRFIFWIIHRNQKKSVYQQFSIKKSETGQKSEFCEVSAEWKRFVI